MKRFFSKVTIGQAGNGYQVLLDTRSIKTAAGKPQVVPHAALAQALADEWAQQGEEIDPGLFRFRDLADYAIDIASAERSSTIQKLLAFAETDTVCYRADPDQALYRRQHDMWEPILTAFEAREGIRMERVSGIIHRPQPSETIAKLQLRLEAMGAFKLAALMTLTSLTASLTLGLSAFDQTAQGETLWQAANLEELWQAEQWGMDAEAQARLNKRHADFVTAWDFAALLRF